MSNRDQLFFFLSFHEELIVLLKVVFHQKNNFIIIIKKFELRYQKVVIFNVNFLIDFHKYYFFFYE